MGCGTVARYGHLPAIQETEGLELQAVFDPVPEAVQQAREEYEIPQAFTDVESFFAAGLDAVTITSPAPCHKQNALDAARAGLPALCEKPLAMNGVEALEMVSAMKDAGRSLYTAFCYRFSPCALKIRDLVRSRAIGNVKSLRLIYNWHLHGKYVEDERGNRTIQKRREGRMLEGGPMVDCGTHQIDLAMFWLESEVIRWQAHGAWVDEYEAPDHMWLHMDHANGAHTMVEMSYSYHHTTKNKRSEFVYELIGSEGVIRYDREARTFCVEDGTGRHDLDFHSEKSFAGMYAEWARALHDGQSYLLTSAEDGARVLEIAQKATEAVMESGKGRDGTE